MIFGQGRFKRALFGQGRKPVPFRVAFTGLSTDDIGLYGQIGNHAAIGFTVVDREGSPLTPDGVKWSASPNPADAATFGTGASPTTFAAADGFFVYLHVTKDIVDSPDLGPLTVTRSFQVRQAPGAFGALAAQLLVANSGPAAYVFAAATGTGLTWTYTLVSPAAGISIVSATRTVTFDTDALSELVAAFTVRATDQYGRTIDRTAGISFGEPASIVIESNGEQASTGEVPIGYVIDRDDPSVRLVVYPADLPAPTAADFTNGSSTYISQGTVALTTTGSPIDFELVGDFFELVRIALLPTGGGDDAVAVSEAFFLDTAAPGLASRSPAQNAVRVPVDARLTMVFTEPMKQQGTVELRNVGGALIESFNVASVGTWSSGDTVWSHKPTADFVEAANLCIRWSGMEDTKSNALADGVGDADWTFEVGQWVISGATIVDSPEASLPIFNGTVIVIG